MAGYTYFRDKVWTPSGAVILPPLIMKALKARLGVRTIIIETSLSRNCPSGKTIYLNGAVNLNNIDSFKVQCIGVSSSNTIVRYEWIEKEVIIEMDDVVNYELDTDDIGNDVIQLDNNMGIETAVVLQNAVSGPMQSLTPVTIIQTARAVVLPTGASFYIDSIMAVNPKEFDIVLKVTNMKNAPNGNFGDIKFSNREAEVIADAFNYIPNVQSTLKGYTNARDVVLLEIKIKAITGTIVPEWDLVMPEYTDLKNSISKTQYVITIDSSGLTQAITV